MGAMHVLVVDDDPSIRRSLERALAFDGHKVTAVDTGASAIAEAVKPDEYDVVVLDLGLPDIDGLDVCKTIRVTGLDVAILVLTARGAVGAGGRRVLVASSPDFRYAFDGALPALRPSPDLPPRRPWSRRAWRLGQHLAAQLRLAFSEAEPPGGKTV